MPHQIGIEITDSLFKLVEVKRRRKKFLLKQYIVHPFPYIWSYDGVLYKREEFIQTIQEALLGQRFRTKQVHVAVSSKHVILKKMKVPEMRKRRYRKWIEENLIPILDLPFSDPLFDFQLMDHVWEDGQEQEILLVLASKEFIDSLVQCLHWCGLDPIRVELSAISLYRWLDQLTELYDQQMISIHISKLEAEISYFVDGQLHKSCCVPLSMRSILDEIDHPHPDPLKPILTEEDQIKQYAEKLLKEVNGEMELSLSPLFQLPNTVWTLTGEGLDLAILQKCLSEKLETKVIIGPSSKEYMVKTLKEDYHSKWLGTSLSVPLGLLFQKGVEA